MAATTVESSMSLSEPEEGCLLVRTSLDKYLCFVSTSDYLQYLISHGDYGAGARVELRGPAGTQLQLKKAAPVQDTPDERKETDPKIWVTGVSLNTAVLSGKISLVKRLVRQSSPTTLDSTDEQGLTLLLHAALTGAHEIAATLLKAGASPDVPHSTSGATPLSLACLQGHSELTKLLLKHRASLSPDVRGCSPLHAAAWGGWGKIVKSLLSHKPSLVAERDIDGRAPLHLAAAKGDVTVCQLLMKKGSQLSETDSCGRTPLHWAILSQQLPSVEHLLASSSGAALLCNQPDSQGATPVHYAAMTGQCSLLTALLNKGASVDVTDARGYSPLFWACACGHVDAARQLIKLTTRSTLNKEASQAECKQGTVEEEDIPADEGGRCLRVACAVGSLDVSQLLLQTSPSLVSERDEEGRTALHTASHHGHTNCLDELIKAGASPNIAMFTDKRTSLHVASERGHCEAVASLLAAGANHNCSTHPHGERPIHLAAQRGHSSIIIELLRRGCVPDIDRAKDGQTALMLAADAGHMQCCRLLIEAGADPSLTETAAQSRTALDLAMAGGHREVADYLISVGAPSRGGKFHRAAVTIQAVWRLHIHRRRQRSRREWSAAAIQRGVRRWRRRRRAGRVRERRERARHRAAAVIQSHWRQYMEGRRRYETTCARLRARLHQEHLAASLLLDELQAQSQSIRLPPAVSPRAPTRSSHKPSATPGYLLQASAPLPTSRITSADLLSPTHHRRVLSVPVTRPRKPLTHSPRHNLPPPPSQTFPSHPTQPLKSQPQPAMENTREEEKSTGLPNIISPQQQPLVNSSTSRQTVAVRRGRKLGGSQKKAVGTRTSKSVSERAGDSLPVIPIASSSLRTLLSGGGEETDQVISNGSAVEELPSLPATPSLVSPPPPSLMSPPSHISHLPPTSLVPPSPPQHTPSPTEPVRENETLPHKVERPTTTPSLSQENENDVQEAQLKVKFETKNESQLDKKEEETRKKEEEEEKVSEKAEGTRHGAESRRYLKQTMFRAAIVGQQQQQGECAEEGTKLDNRLLGPIQRYDRLNTVLALLQRVQGGETEEEEEGLRLTDLQQHIQSALDEAVRLRADTESLQHSAKMKVPRKPANSVH